MTKVFSPDDLLRYLYKETSEAENKVIELLITTDKEFAEKYKEFQSTIRQIHNKSASPSEASVQKILQYSRSQNLQSHSQ